MVLALDIPRGFWSGYRVARWILLWISRRGLYCALVSFLDFARRRIWEADSFLNILAAERCKLWGLQGVIWCWDCWSYERLPRGRPDAPHCNALAGRCPGLARLICLRSSHQDKVLMFPGVMEVQKRVFLFVSFLLAYCS